MILLLVVAIFVYDVDIFDIHDANKVSSNVEVNDNDDGNNKIDNYIIYILLMLSCNLLIFRYLQNINMYEIVHILSVYHAIYV